MATRQQYATQLFDRTVELILTEGQFDMSEFHGRLANGTHTYRPTCGVACCIAGNIILAYEELDDQGREHFFADATVRTERRARTIWGKAFGQGAAARLDFLGNQFAHLPHNQFPERLRSVTPEQAVAHLLGQGLDCTPDPQALSTIAEARKRLAARRT